MKAVKSEHMPSNVVPRYPQGAQWLCSYVDFHPGVGERAICLSQMQARVLLRALDNFKGNIKMLEQ